MILRMTQKMAKKINSLVVLNDVPNVDDPFLDWSTNLFRIHRTQYIIITNTTSLYSMVMLGRGITNQHSFAEKALTNMYHFLEDDGNISILKRFIEPNLTPIMFAKSLNRSVTGSMNDLITQAKFHLDVEDMSPWDLSFRLNETPMSYIKHESPGVAFRAMAVKKLFQSR